MRNLKSGMDDHFSDIQVWRDENGQLHNDHGPAQIYADGTKIWYQHGKIHREDGPAVIYWDKTSREYFLCGKAINFMAFILLTEGPVNELPLYLGLGFDEYIEKRLKNESK